MGICPIGLQRALSPGKYFPILSIRCTEFAARPPAGTDIVTACRMTILIAEDNAVLAKSIIKSLARDGYHAVAVHSLSAARAMLAHTPVEALCLDLQLPDGNGMSIAEDRPMSQVPIVVMTGTGSAEDRRRAEKCGVTAFLTKPFALSELTDILRRALAEPDSPKRTHAN